MAQTHDLGPLFAQRLYYHSAHPPLIALTRSQEIESPFRTGKCLVLRAPLTKRAVAVGVWLTGKSEEDALMDAMGARVVQDNAVGDMEDWL